MQENKIERSRLIGKLRVPDIDLNLCNEGGAMNFQELIFALERFWADQGCVIQQPYDTESRRREQ